MKKDAFLKKFEGRTEQIGRNGFSDIMNNVHINIVDYIPKPKKVKIPRVKEDKYGHIKSEVSAEFNKNINFIPQTKIISLSPKRNKTEEFGKTENNIIKNNKNNNMNKFKNKNNSGTYKTKPKEKEKPIKLFKNIQLNIINRNDKSKNFSDMQLSNKEDNEKSKKRVLNTENNNVLIGSKKRSNSLNLNRKLPKISQTSVTQKNPKNNNILNNLENKPNKNPKRVNTYTPNFNGIINNVNRKLNNDNIKRSYSKGVNTENTNLKKYIIKSGYNLPRIDKKVNKMDYIENDKSIKLYNKQKNLILNNIKKDFLMLDSIKNKSNNISKSQRLEENIFYNNNINMSLDNKINNYNNNKKNISNNYSLDYFMNSNNYKNKTKKDESNIPYSSNLDQKNYNNYNERMNFNEDFSSLNIEEKKPHTSFDYPKKIPKLKNKLDIIDEENEEENKYITDVKFTNENKENLNSLEILMKQRALFQNKMPNDSRFKIK